LPGTGIFNRWLGDKALSSLDWSKFSFANDAIFSTEGLNCSELTLLQKKAFRSFYLRPRIFVSTLSKIKPRQLKWLYKRVKEYAYFKRS
jgi:hypothetical protein